MTLQNLADEMKKIRGFSAETYLKEKLFKINEFFREEGLDSCVLGLSGGVDSAVVFKLLILAAEQPYSPLKLVCGMFVPIYADGITGQEIAGTLCLELTDNIDSNKASFSVKDITTAVNSLYYENANSWARGQLACIVRTSVFYGEAALLQQAGYKSIVVGTTNRDEGSYIGFFGKASDAMVDLQPIADLHKSEVYEIAELLDVPQSIIKRTPQGDVWNYSVDEEMIGCPYWFLEMYLNLHETQTISHIKNTILKFDQDEITKYLEYAKAIEKIHKQNEHKYKVGSPARFIDVMDRAIRGGWQDENKMKIREPHI